MFKKIKKKCKKISIKLSKGKSTKYDFIQKKIINEK